MIEIKDLEKCEKFVSLFMNVKAFTDTISLIFQNDGLYIQGMDSAHISMYEIQFYREWFDSYDLCEESSYSIGLSTNIFSKVLATRPSTHTIFIDLKNQNSIHVKFEKDKKNTKSFTIQLMDLDCEVMEIPDQEYSVTAVINAKEFKTQIDELAQFSDNVFIKCEKTYIEFTTKDDVCSFDNKLYTDTFQSYYVNEETSAEFNLKYIQLFTKFIKMSDTIRMYLNNGIPIRFQYIIDKKTDSYIQFYLAPKISDDE